MPARAHLLQGERGIASLTFILVALCFDRNRAWVSTALEKRAERILVDSTTMIIMSCRQHILWKALSWYAQRVHIL